MVGFGSSSRLHAGDYPYDHRLPVRPARAGGGTGISTAPPAGPAPTPEPEIDRVALSTVPPGLPGGNPAAVPVVGTPRAAPAAPPADPAVKKAKKEGIRDETDYRIFRVMDRGMMGGARWNVSVDNKPAIGAVLVEAFTDGNLTKAEWEKVTRRTMTEAAWNAFTCGKGVIKGKEQLATALEILERNLDVLNLEYWQLAEKEDVTLASANDLAPILRDMFNRDTLSVPFRAVFKNARTEAEGTIQRQRAAVLQMRGMEDDDIRLDIQDFMEKDETKLLVDQAAAARVQHEIAYILSQKSIDVKFDLTDPLVFELYTQPGGLFERAITEDTFPAEEEWEAFGAKAARVKEFRAWVADPRHPERARELGDPLSKLNEKKYKGSAEWLEGILANFDQVDIGVTQKSLIDAVAHMELPSEGERS